ncbi:MAG TPA: hypothetical protein VFP89_06705 [Propionibacteriaceae bacterium]|nr:hypothetical protein [Propionibacteriaceae bacterium]
MQVALTRGEWSDPARGRMTVGAWSEKWLAAKGATLKATTVESYRSLPATCILPTWAEVPLAAVGHADVAAWVAALSGSVGASRCRRAATVLSGMMAAAVRDQRIARNPCLGVALPRLPEQRQRFLTMVELERLAECAGPYRTMVLVLGLCGLRFGECSVLRVRSVDVLGRRLRVSESVSDVGGRQVWSSTKTHQSRDVPAPVAGRSSSGGDEREGAVGPAVHKPRGRVDFGLGTGDGECGSRRSPPRAWKSSLRTT